MSADTTQQSLWRLRQKTRNEYQRRFIKFEQIDAMSSGNGRIQLF